MLSSCIFCHLRIPEPSERDAGCKLANSYFSFYRVTPCWKWSLHFWLDSSRLRSMSTFCCQNNQRLEPGYQLPVVEQEGETLAAAACCFQSSSWPDWRGSHVACRNPPPPPPPLTWYSTRRTADYFARQTRYQNRKTCSKIDLQIKLSCDLNQNHIENIKTKAHAVIRLMHFQHNTSH